MTSTSSSTPETAICPKIAINGQDPTTDRIEAAYSFLLAWLVVQGKARSPVGWAGILTTLIEWSLLQAAHHGIPEGPSVPPVMPTDEPVYPDNVMQHQISAADRLCTTSKKLWKEYTDAEDGAKAIWIEACGKNILDELCRPIIGYSGVTLRNMVT